MEIKKAVKRLKYVNKRIATFFAYFNSATENKYLIFSLL